MKQVSVSKQLICSLLILPSIMKNNWSPLPNITKNFRLQYKNFNTIVHNTSPGNKKPCHSNFYSTVNQMTYFSFNGHKCFLAVRTTYMYIYLERQVIRTSMVQHHDISLRFSAAVSVCDSFTIFLGFFFGTFILGYDKNL